MVENLEVFQYELENTILRDHDCSLAYVVALDWQPEKLWAKYENGLAHEVTGDELKSLAAVVKESTSVKQIINRDITLGAQIYTTSSIVDNHELFIGTKGSTNLVMCLAKDCLSINSYPKEWAEFNRTSRYHFLGYPKFNQGFVIPLGYEPFTGDVLFPETKILTVYAYPDELDYELIREKKDWFNLEVFNRVSKEKIELEKLVSAEFLSGTLDGKFSGKLIYVSMGSIASADLNLIKRLVQILSKTNHKYIFSKGPRHSEYVLAPNMYGDRYLPQTAIILHVDLMISHGGNNTLTETFAEGKPLIILPMFADQFDNAQRLQETGLGARIDSYTFTDRELIDTFDKFLND